MLLVVIIAVIALLHIAGTELRFYWRLGLYDIIVHILGGLWIAMAMLAVVKRAGVEFTTKRNILIVGICTTIIIGFVWEFFELQSGVTTVRHKEFLGDTFGDIIADSVGGLIGSLYSIKYIFLWNQKKQQ